VRRITVSPFLLTFFGVVVLLAYANHAFFFERPVHEDGDFAVNALQIERAKHLDELYGNYSRFHFNHPGPAFFYVYAIGELVLHDLFLFTPSPHSAHALIGLMLQAAFFTGALTIARRWVQSPWFLPIALLAAAVHFGLARNAFSSIWPPHVLVMPFLCFIIACASTAAGRAEHLPAAALAGCFLVHGYVAQPLYVLTLFLLTYVLFWRRVREPGETWASVVRRYRRPHAIAAACIALFVLPILIDFTYGSDSNFARILEFLGGHRNEHQSLWRSFLYLLAFFSYVHNQDEFLPEHGSADASFLNSHWPHLLIWAAVFGVIIWYVRRLRRSETAERPFAFALALMLAVTLSLSLLWGIIQVGPMFEFNGQFYYGMLYAIVLLFVVAICSVLPARGSLIGGAALCVIAATVGWTAQHPPISTQGPDYDSTAASEAAMQADPAPKAPKLLVFDHDDWGFAASTALDLKRAGKSYRVDGNWTFMFGRYRTFRPEPPNFDLKGMSIWRFTRKGPPNQGIQIDKDLRVYFQPFSLDPATAVIDCAKGGNLNLYTIFGFTAPDGDAAWTNMPEAGLQFLSPPAAHDVQLQITASPFTPHSRNLFSQPMDLFVNGHKIDSFDLRDRQAVFAHIPREIWNLNPTVSIVFVFPNANSPMKLKLSADPRILAWAIEQMRFSYLE
jgi:hypothetical protein